MYSHYDLGALVLECVLVHTHQSVHLSHVCRYLCSSAWLPTCGYAGISPTSTSPGLHHWDWVCSSWQPTTVLPGEEFCCSIIPFVWSLYHNFLFKAILVNWYLFLHVCTIITVGKMTMVWFAIIIANRISTTDTVYNNSFTIPVLSVYTNESILRNVFVHSTYYKRI